MIDRVSRMLDERADSLLDVLSQIGSRSIVERAETALARYSQVKKLLADKYSELQGRIADAQRLIASNRSTISIYQSRIEQNSCNIELLKAAIASSVDSESLIQNYLEGLDSLLDDATKLLEEQDQNTAAE